MPREEAPVFPQYDVGTAGPGGSGSGYEQIYKNFQQALEQSADPGATSLGGLTTLPLGVGGLRLAGTPSRPGGGKDTKIGKILEVIRSLPESMRKVLVERKKSEMTALYPNEHMVGGSYTEAKPAKELFPIRARAQGGGQRSEGKVSIGMQEGWSGAGESMGPLEAAVHELTHAAENEVLKNTGGVTTKRVVESPYYRGKGGTALDIFSKLPQEEQQKLIKAVSARYGNTVERMGPGDIATEALAQVMEPGHELAKSPSIRAAALEWLETYIHPLAREVQTTNVSEGTRRFRVGRREVDPTLYGD